MRTSPAASLAAFNKFLCGESLIAVAHNSSLCLFAPLLAAANAEPADPLPLRASLLGLIHREAFPVPQEVGKQALCSASQRREHIHVSAQQEPRLTVDATYLSAM